jgi:hypothetical protein
MDGNLYQKTTEQRNALLNIYKKTYRQHAICFLGSALDIQNNAIYANMVVSV